VLGTAFCIGDGTFLTAAHVMKEALAHSQFGIGFAAPNLTWRRLPVEDVEIIEDFDVALFRSRAPNFEPLPWIQDDLLLLADIHASGFPYALNPRMGSLNARAFRGTVSGTDRFERLPTHPLVYELSFQSPRGLSGAPLLTWGANPKVAGVVIGNSTSEMVVFSNRERVSDTSETIVERFEALHLGVALRSSQLLGLEFSTLGRSLASFLNDADLLHPLPRPPN
jgi:hypothetical protein